MPSTDEIRVLSPTGILGYGFPRASLEEGMRRRPHVIAVDGGSTDGGPYYLGVEPELSTSGGHAGSFRDFIGRDLEPLLEAAVGAQIPLIIGSAGFAGANLHLAGTVGLVFMAAAKLGLRFRMATIGAELDKSHVKERLRRGHIEPCGAAPELTEADVDDSVRLVAQMGVEPFVSALNEGAQVIVAGRANDPSMFAALPWQQQYDRGLALHMAKILECGAIAADPGSGSDALLGTLRHDHFLLEPLNAERRCSVTSVAAHSLYEKSDPVRLYSPGGHVDLSDARFEQHDARSVRVSGSRYVPAERYMVKIEGAKRIGFRTIAIAGIRDASVIGELDSLLCRARGEVKNKFADLDENDYHIAFHVYGRDGVMGPLEPTVTRGTAPGRPSHELGLVMETVTSDQALATSINGHLRSVLLHMGFAGRTSTAGNLAFPFSPMDMPAGPVYQFSAYHLMREPDPLALFPIDYVQVGA